MVKTRRIEVRIEPELYKALDEYCTKSTENQSEFIRVAIQNRLIGDLRQMMFRVPGDPFLYKAYKVFINEAPDNLKRYFEDLVGPVEEDLVKSIPQRTLEPLKAMKFITKRGEDAFKKRLKSL
jgi:hypothetical protein